MSMYAGFVMLVIKEVHHVAGSLASGGCLSLVHTRLL